MRDIKFRAKPLYDNGWVYGGIGQCLQSFFIIEQDTLTKTLVKAETIGQFTGISDKHGKEIYEGDILKRRYFNEPDFYIVKYGHYDNYESWEDNISGLGFYLGWEDEIYHPHYFTDDEYDIEIIGNIHDDPAKLV